MVVRDEILRPWRLKEDAPTKKYRVAWVVEPGKDFSALENLATEVRYITMGYEKSIEKISQSILESRKLFDPDNDIIVPVGRVLAVLLVGLIYGQIPRDIAFAIYSEGVYHEGLWDKAEGFGTEDA
jgi:hypothetical protein